MSLEDRRGNLVTHRIERCQFTGNRINDSSALSQNWAGAAALFLYGDGAARQTCVRDGPPKRHRRLGKSAERIAVHTVMALSRLGTAVHGSVVMAEDRRRRRFAVLDTAFSQNTVKTRGGAVVLGGTARFAFTRCIFSASLVCI